MDYLDHYYRRRLQALASVDDLIDTVFAKLEELDLLDNTYVIYTTDNGYHIGQHRLQPGKTTCYEEDVNIPMYIRGPGVPKKETVYYPTTHTDVVPTIFKLAGIPLRPEFDGAPMPVTRDIPAVKHEHVGIEFWGGNLQEGEHGGSKSALRSDRLSIRHVFIIHDIDKVRANTLLRSFIPKQYLQGPTSDRGWV